MGTVVEHKTDGTLEVRLYSKCTAPKMYKMYTSIGRGLQHKGAHVSPNKAKRRPNKTTQWNGVML